MVKKKLSFEEAMKRLEEIVVTLENEEVSLDNAMALYKEGLTLSALCEEKLGKAEGELSQLIQEVTGKLATQPFTLEEGK